ncbi:MAG: alpha-glucosidase/alpha-galactosidase [Armatimonadetes bacterium]|nr:alpha-glucosidase/alpha-galactosidase [Armatimonadota bacterium]MDE2208000.1 alpha-glucosidase/alpha-galactosidase [Armatimonadota bacterium]
MAIKVAIIGAGSVGFTRGMVRDILCVPELQDTHFALTDINPHNLDMVMQLTARDVREAGLPALIEAAPNRRAAISGAKYVFSFVRVGGLEAFATDIDIPLRYGVDQCVGDTLGPGGIMYAQRTIACLLEFCRDMREVCPPDVLFLNYSNPMAMNVWACSKYGGVKTVGLCHGIEGGHWQIAQALGLPVTEVDIVCAGINHQTWYIQVSHKGRDLTGELLAAFERHPEYSRTEKVRIDMMRRFGYFSTESNGHLSEYVPWYRKRPEEIPDWIDLGSWINGETGGYLRVCTEGRNWFEHDFGNWMQQAPLTFDPASRGHERGSYILEALETGRIYRAHFNVMNGGCITNLPADCCVEAPGYVDLTGINIPIVGDLPLGCAAVCSASIGVQRLAVEAAVHGDDALLRQAMMMDPLTGAVCNPPEIWQMVDEMLVAQEQWLPQYRRCVKAADARIRKGKVHAARAYSGAARLPTRTVEEMQRDRAAANRNAGASDKAQMRKSART